MRPKAAEHPPPLRGLRPLYIGPDADCDPSLPCGRRGRPRLAVPLALQALRALVGWSSSPTVSSLRDRADRCVRPPAAGGRVLHAASQIAHCGRFPSEGSVRCRRAAVQPLASTPAPSSVMLERAPRASSSTSVASVRASSASSSTTGALPIRSLVVLVEADVGEETRACAASPTAPESAGCRRPRASERPHRPGPGRTDHGARMRPRRCPRRCRYQRSSIRHDLAVVDGRGWAGSCMQQSHCRRRLAAPRSGSALAARLAGLGVDPQERVVVVPAPPQPLDSSGLAAQPALGGRR